MAKARDREKLQRLHQLTLTAIPARDRFMLQLQDQGWSYDELMDATGLGREAVTRCIRRARQARTLERTTTDDQKLQPTGEPDGTAA